MTTRLPTCTPVSAMADLPPSCDPAAGDLALLVHRAAHSLRTVLDRACRDQGLTDGRDWLVLTVLSDGAPRTQLDLARLLGIDKTTLTAVLDRLDRLGMVVRRADPADRRARIPEATEAGRATWAAVSRARDEVERSLLGDVPPEQLQQLRSALVRLAGAEGVDMSGACSGAAATGGQQPLPA
ncbi:MAG TPA: MarR family transcriptional regulator [Mycobacteriales bacterium]|nr:MarR family transcriptional regulator [Mycobacteriales bacterium]